MDICEKPKCERPKAEKSSFHCLLRPGKLLQNNAAENFVLKATTFWFVYGVYAKVA